MERIVVAFLTSLKRGASRHVSVMMSPTKGSVLEAELIRRAQQGDEAAFELLVQEHQEAVFRLAYLFTDDPHAAQDVAQEAFIRAYRMLRRFDTERPLRPWLLGITRHLALNHRRALGRYLNILRRTIAHEPENVRHEPDVWGKWEAEALRTAVKKLPVTDREVIYLRFYLELSVRETAETLEVAEGTVKSRLSRALERLRRVVEQDYPLLKEERSL